jgi:hypothetical protein
MKQERREERPLVFGKTEEKEIVGKGKGKKREVFLYRHSVQAISPCRARAQVLLLPWRSGSWL